MQPKVRLITLPGGLRLEVAEQGAADGLPVLLLHGGTDSWRSFEPVLPHLPAQWRVVAPSQRGHGASDKPHGGYRTRDFAADAAALIEALELAPAIVVGHSMGAANAMRLAIDRPELVRGLVGVAHEGERRVVHDTEPHVNPLGLWRLRLLSVLVPETLL